MSEEKSKVEIELTANAQTLAGGLAQANKAIADMAKQMQAMLGNADPGKPFKKVKEGTDEAGKGLDGLLGHLKDYKKEETQQGRMIKFFTRDLSAIAPISAGAAAGLGQLVGTLVASGIGFGLAFEGAKMLGEMFTEHMHKSEAAAAQSRKNAREIAAALGEITASFRRFRTEELSTGMPQTAAAKFISNLIKGLEDEQRQLETKFAEQIEKRRKLRKKLDDALRPGTSEEIAGLESGAAPAFSAASVQREVDAAKEGFAELEQAEALSAAKRVAIEEEVPATIYAQYKKLQKDIDEELNKNKIQNRNKQGYVDSKGVVFTAEDSAALNNLEIQKLEIRKKYGVQGQQLEAQLDAEVHKEILRRREEREREYQNRQEAQLNQAIEGAMQLSQSPANWSRGSSYVVQDAMARQEREQEKADQREKDRIVQARAARQEMNAQIATASQFAQQIGAGFGQALVGAKNFAQVMAQVASQIVQTIAQMAIQNITAAAAQAGANAAVSQSMIPIVGPVLAISAMAAMFSAVMAMASNVGSASKGWQLPSSGGPFPAILHPDEKVLPARISKNFDRLFDSMGAGGGGGGGVTNHFNFPNAVVADAPGIRRLLESNAYQQASRSARRDGKG